MTLYIKAGVHSKISASDDKNELFQTPTSSGCPDPHSVSGSGGGCCDHSKLWRHLPVQTDRADGFEGHLQHSILQRLLSGQVSS